MYLDSHCHLYPEYDFVNLSPEEIVKNAIENGVTQMWLASTEKKDILWNLDFCKKYKNNLRTWVGWHPENYLSFDENFLAQKLTDNLTLNLRITNDKLPNKSQNTNSEFQITNKAQSINFTKINNEILRSAQDDRGLIVGIGEIGLDFACHPITTKEEQIKVFESQLKLARKYNLPVAIHCRDAIKETLEVMRKYSDLTYLWHCFNLNKEDTKVLFSDFKNVFVGINAIFTYKSGSYIKDSLKLVPIDKILIETDSPFLMPRPFKYSFNTPEGVVSIYKTLSEFLNISEQALVNIICENSTEIINDKL